MDVTERWNDLILNSVDVRLVDLTRLRLTPSSDRIYSIDDHVRERICQPHALPRTNADVKELRVHHPSLGLALHLTTRYTQLDLLTLIDIDGQSFPKFIPGKSFLLRVEVIEEFEFLFVNRS